MITNTEKSRRYRAKVYADPDRHAAYRAMMRAHEARYRARLRARLADDPAKLAAHKAKHRAWKARFDDKQRVLKATNAEYYALWRAEQRGRYAAKVASAGGHYHPNLRLRVPDWAKFRQPILDTRSVYLLENRTPSQTAYARDWVREHFF